MRRVLGRAGKALLAQAVALLEAGFWTGESLPIDNVQGGCVVNRGMTMLLAALLLGCASCVSTGSSGSKMSLSSFKKYCKSSSLETSPQMCDYYAQVLSMPHEDRAACLGQCQKMRKDLHMRGNPNYRSPYLTMRRGYSDRDLAERTIAMHDVGERPYYKSREVKQAADWCERYCRSNYP